MNLKNKKYWNNYYKSKDNNIYPSNFALFVSKKFVKKNTLMLDVGSGDGRDTFYHRKKVKEIMGVDLSNIVIKKNKLKAKRLGFKNITFKNLSSNKLNLIKTNNINFIYARFFLHAINEKSENIFLKNILKNFQIDTLIALEFRTIKDVLMKKGKKISKYERITDHYRRFIDPNKFQKKLKKLNFNILYKKLGINMSKSPYDNPHLCRIIFSRASKL